MKDACAWTAYRVRLPTVDARKSWACGLPHKPVYEHSVLKSKMADSYCGSPRVRLLDTGARHQEGLS